VTAYDFVLVLLRVALGLTMAAHGYNKFFGKGGVAGTGAGKLTLDYALFHSAGVYDYLYGWCGLLIAVVFGLAGGIGQLAIFYRPPASKA
jgi:uncharacterized membrane protein YphA (DoxX/SURF4 family)